MKRALSILTLAAAFTLPAIALAADDFVPLAPLPNLNGSYTDISAYVNAIFNFSIMAAAILAVIMIMYHGLQYMLKESVPETHDHMIGIRSAVGGLVLLLLSWLILHVINPQILDLKALQSDLGNSQTVNGITITTNTPIQHVIENPQGLDQTQQIQWPGN